MYMSRRPNYDVLNLFRLWHSPMRSEEIAAELGLTRAQLQAAASRHALGPRPGCAETDTGKGTTDDPTPEEIAAGCERVRRRWSKAEELRRRGASGIWIVPGDR